MFEVRGKDCGNSVVAVGESEPLEILGPYNRGCNAHVSKMVSEHCEVGAFVEGRDLETRGREIGIVEHGVEAVFGFCGDTGDET